jgi:hypothetical protein
MYEKNLVTIPMDIKKIVHHDYVGEVKNFHYPPFVHLNKFLIPGAAVAIQWNWVWGMPEPNDFMPRHTHSNDEILFHLGNDPHNPLDLGAVIEISVGDDVLTIDKTSVLYIPAGVEHCPLVWKRVDRPHLEIAIELGGEYD